MPEFLAGAGVVDGLAEFAGHFERLGIHVGEHEGLAGFVINGHGGDEAVVIEFRGEIEGLVQFFFWGTRGEL